LAGRNVETPYKICIIGIQHKKGVQRMTIDKVALMEQAKEVLKNAGVDMSKPAAIELALQGFEEKIEKFEKLYF